MSCNSHTVRLGVIGAGAICRDRHLPGLKKLDGVELVAVCNRTPESSRRVAEQFGFAHVESDWRRLVQRDDIDAVLIGTWPYTHAEMSIAALEAGRHVFCQARMAATLDEARRMAAAAAAHPGLINHVCPPPTRMPFEPFIRRQLHADELGELLEVRLVALGGDNLGPLNWRQRVEYSGIQILAVGIFAETLIALVGQFDTLLAHAATPIAAKSDDDGRPYAIGIPQTVTVAGTLESGVSFTETHSGLHRGPRQRTLDLVGSKATLRLDFDAAQLRLNGEPIDVPADQQRGWRVEEDFIHAVRTGQEPGFTNTFAEALRYMVKMEAIHVSAREGRAVQRRRFEDPSDPSAAR